MHSESTMNSAREKWDEIYRKLPEDPCPEPAFVLSYHEYLLPMRGDAIDLACGMGGNALFLAKRGYRTQAWDISKVALSRLQEIAKRQRLEVVCEIRDLESADLGFECFDVIVLTRYLDRNLRNSLVAALRPGGLLYFQTFVRDKDPNVGPRNPDHLLAQNELVQLFPDLVLRAYCEAGQVGDLARGLRNEAYLVAQKAYRK